ncbi:flagellar basal-body rod protein FlgG [Candidatus Haliotispira prima]|uniref:Flagellar basal-body rod protein FlgG n=1 Tax=Candidatus Haliotispira prima TaxID=3034016 RepID=A0ABY8MIN7_9SPIO|nr:flagellar basal-body rod protein FlgG [Candidatus Haliotispira prima]
MIRSLWTAASGMNSTQRYFDTIANNLANVNTVGYRQVRAEFEDLLYAHRKLAGTPATDETVRPLDVSVGHGSRVAATQRIFNQGIIKASDSPVDIAIRGEGFFRVEMPNGEYAYTRNGAFKIDANKQIVTAQGFRLSPEIILPENINLEKDLIVTRDGKVNVRINDDITGVGQIELFRFVNPAGLKALGENVYQETQASGEAIQGSPEDDKGMGTLYQRFLEYSNVNMAKEMVNMIVANRAYEFNSRAIQTSDSMLNTAVNIKR